MCRLVPCLLLAASLGCSNANEATVSDETVDQLLAQGNDLRAVDPDAALEKYRRAAEMSEGNAQALNNLALLSAENGRHDDAVAALARLQTVDAKQFAKTKGFVDEWSLNFLGGAHIQLDMGELQKASENYQLYIKYNPQSDEGFTGRGNVLTAQGDFDSAAKAFGTALRLNPNSGMAHAGLGQLQIKQEQWGAAIESFTAALQIFPDRYPAYLARADAYDGKGDSLLAKEDRERAEAIRSAQSDLTK